MSLDLIRSRRSVRRFSAQTITQQEQDLLAEAALRAPSSRRLFPWQFVFVDDQKLLQALAAAKPHGAAFLAEAPLAIAVAADPQQCDVWVEDCAIAAAFLLLAAAELGLGCCWVQLRLRNHESGQAADRWAAQLLGLPPGALVPFVLALGYAQEPAPPHARDELLWDRIHSNRFVATD